MSGQEQEEWRATDRSKPELAEPGQLSASGEEGQLSAPGEAAQLSAPDELSEPALGGRMPRRSPEDSAAAPTPSVASGADPGPAAVAQRSASAEAPALAESPEHPSPDVVPAGTAELAGSSAAAETEPAKTAELSGAAADQAEAEPASVLLRGLGLRGAHSWAFRNVDLIARPAELVVVTGPSGSGRSALLLAIAGRLRPTAGSMEVVGVEVAAGRAGRSGLRHIRHRVAVARLDSHIGLDPDLTVAVNARDAADWARRDPAQVQRRLEEWRRCSGLGLSADTPVADLTTLEATAAHLLLAAVIDPEVIVLDDADSTLTAPERDRLWQLAADVAATGPTVIATTTEAPVQADVQLVLHRYSTSHAASHRDEHSDPDAPADHEVSTDRAEPADRADPTDQDTTDQDTPTDQDATDKDGTER